MNEAEIRSSLQALPAVTERISPLGSELITWHNKQAFPGCTRAPERKRYNGAFNRSAGRCCPWNKTTLCSHWPIRTACPTCVCRRSKKSCQRGFVVLWLLIDLLHWQSLPLSNIQLFDNYCCYSAVSGRQGESFQSIIEDGIYFCCLFSPGGFRMTQFERNHTERCVTGTVARSQVTVCLGRPTCLSVSDTTKSGGC